VKSIIEIVVASVGPSCGALLGIAALGFGGFPWAGLIIPRLRVGGKKGGNKFPLPQAAAMSTMPDEHNKEERFARSNERNGPFFKMENDPRITRCGRMLRKEREN